jgi:hypothetical protein
MAGNTAQQLPDAREVWVPFALHPLRLETPLGWHPLLADWADRSARVRWETLTSTPLELNWLWEPAPTQDLGDLGRRRLQEAWKRESGAAEGQARKANTEFRWTGDARSVRGFADLEAEGTVREYLWGKQPGAVAVLGLVAAGRRALVSVACRPPASCGDAARALKRVFRSLRLAPEREPFRVAFAGLNLELPAAFRLQNIRGREGHAYMDAESGEQRVSLARLGFAEWHLAASSLPKIQASLAKILFDRSEPHETGLSGTAGSSGMFGSRPAPKDPESAGTEVQEHRAELFKECCRCHIRFGDWVLRKIARRWAGASAVLAWHCPQTHSLWAVGARCGEQDAEALARSIAGQLACHGQPGPGAVDWGPYAQEEARSGPEAAVPAGSAGAPAEQMQPVEQRRRQLRFRIRPAPEVRLERGVKDGTGDLVYEAAAADGLVARLLRGGRPPQRFYKRLALDALGRRTWESLAGGPSVGELVAMMSREFAAHPVEVFPKLLGFLRSLGERRLVEAVGEGKAADEA